MLGMARGSPQTVVGPLMPRPAGEDAAIESIARALREHFGAPPEGQLWIGDDAAVVAGTATLLLTTDAAVAGVHADLELVSLDDLGWKALTATVSDIAAMGGRPAYTVIALCGPPDTDVELVNRGVMDAAQAWRCPVVGGDLSGAPAVTIVASVTGTLEGDPAPAVRRSGARAGHRVLVTGPLGASAAGLRLLREGRTGGGAAPQAWERLVTAHRRPVARLGEGWAARSAGASALIDISDGLAIDLHRLAAASGVGLELDAVPVAPGATLAEALGGGEDYELVMTVPPERADALVARFDTAGLRLPIDVGRCTDDPLHTTLEGADLPVQGWEHQFQWPERRSR